MESHLQRFLISTIGFVYASTGFALSILGTLLQMFIYTQQSPELQKKALVLSRRRRRTHNRMLKGKAKTKENEKASSLPTTSLAPVHVRPKRRMDSHRRSRSSIPVITIHHPDSIGTFSATLAITSPEGILSAPVLYSEPMDISEPEGDVSPLLPPVEIHEQNPETPRQKFRFATLKATWTERKERKPNLSRCISSPDLSPTSPHAPVLVTRKSTSSVHSTESPKCMKWRSKSLQRTPPAEPQPKKEKLPALRIEKKRSQPLQRARTQPYEAPYFFPPPVPVPRRSGPVVGDNGANTDYHRN